MTSTQIRGSFPAADPDQPAKAGGPKRRHRKFAMLLFVFAAWGGIVTAAMLRGGADETFEYCCGRILSLWSSNADIQEVFGMSDAGSFARGGERLLETGSELGPGSAPVWSPGMFWIHAAILGLVGKQGPAVLAMVAVSAVAWASFLTLFSALLMRWTRSRLLAFFPLLLFAIPSVWRYIFQMGVFFSETIAIPVFGIGLLLLAEASRQGRTALAIGAGFMLTTAAYLRSTFELLMQPILVLLLLAVAIEVARTFWGSRKAGIGTEMVEGQSAVRDILYSVVVRARLGMTAIALLVYYALTIPYRLFNYMRFGQFRWGFTDYYFIYPWMPDEEYSDGQQFVLRGGGNIACKVEETLCQRFAENRRLYGEHFHSSDVYKDEFFKAFLNNPIEWITLKAPIVGRHWMSEPTMGEPIVTNPVPGLMLAAMVTAATILAIYLVWRRVYFPVIIIGGVLGGSVVIWLLLHMEVRYTYPIQILAPLLLIIAVIGFAGREGANVVGTAKHS